MGVGRSQNWLERVLNRSNGNVLGEELLQVLCFTWPFDEVAD